MVQWLRFYASTLVGGMGSIPGWGTKIPHPTFCMPFSQKIKNKTNKKRYPSPTLYTLVVGGLVDKSCLTLAAPWTVAHQAPLSIGVSRQSPLEWGAMPSSRGSSDPEI